LSNKHNIYKYYTFPYLLIINNAAGSIIFRHMFMRKERPNCVSTVESRKLWLKMLS